VVFSLGRSLARPAVERAKYARFAASARQLPPARRDRHAIGSVARAGVSGRARHPRRSGGFGTDGRGTPAHFARSPGDCAQ